MPADHALRYIAYRELVTEWNRSKKNKNTTLFMLKSYVIYISLHP